MLPCSSGSCIFPNGEALGVEAQLHIKCSRGKRNIPGVRTWSRPSMFRCLLSGWEVRNDSKWHRVRALSQSDSESAAFYTKTFAKQPSASLQSRSAPNDDFFLFSAICEKKQCKYCDFYSLCKHPDVMQAELDFSSHHYSLYLAIHAQTFVHLEIYGWFFFKKQIFFRSVRGTGCNCLTRWTFGGRLSSPSESLCNL